MDILFTSVAVLAAFASCFAVFSAPEKKRAPIPVRAEKRRSDFTRR